MATKTIDPRKLARLAAAARKLGITRLLVAPDGGVEFDLGPLPSGADRHQVAAQPPPPPPPRPDRGSDAWVRARFARKN